MSEHKLITSLEDSLQKNGQKVALCYGQFAAIHPGHIRYFEFGRSLADALWVAVKGDNGRVDYRNEYGYSALERCRSIASLSMVDKVICINDIGLEDLLKHLRPDHLILGKEFEHQRAHEVQDAINAAAGIGCTVKYHAGQTNLATLPKDFETFSQISSDRRNKFQESCRKQGINIADLNQSVEGLSRASMLVIGDAIVDQYVSCDALGMSAEAPVLVVRERDSEEYIGGAAIVAAHVTSLGATCHFVSVCGWDEAGRTLQAKLDKLGVVSHLINDDSRPTSYKIRYMVGTQKLFRVSRLEEHEISKHIEDLIVQKIRSIGAFVNGVLISDFVYGVITSRVLEVIQNVAKQYNIPIFADLQCSSQIGDVSKFKNVDLVTPTEKEARIALGNNDAGIEWLATELLEATGNKNLIMKLGPDGFIVYQHECEGTVVRQHFPALVTNPIDVSGAGDALFATVAVAMSAGYSVMTAAALGACSAAISVGTVGNLPIPREKLINVLARLK